MKKLLSPLFVVALVVLAVTAGPLAQAEPLPTPTPTGTPTPPPPPPPPPVYSPQPGAIFNNPTGTPDEQMALLDHVTKSIDSTPPGAAIRIAVYSFSYNPMSDALIAAHRRGVRVKILVDSHTQTPEMVQLKKALGTDKTKSSYYRTCKYGCMSSRPSFMHSKLYLFSTSGKSKRVSMIASANPAWSGGTQSWNNIYTIVGDEKLYAANIANFSDMLRDKTDTRYYRTVSSGPYKEYMFPRAGSTRNSDTLYNVLREVKCTGAAPGYGNSTGKTVVRIAAYKWTALRVNVAQQATALKKQGCDVQVIYSGDTVDREVAYELFAQRIPVYNGRLDRDNDGVLDLYIHSKYVLINGVYGSKNNVKAVYTGSQNFSSNSLRESNETMLRIALDPVYDQFLGNYNLIRSKWTVRVTKAPRPTAGTDSRLSDGGTSTATTRYRNGDDYSLDPGDE